MTFQFPNDFTWGTATAAYQVEGAIEEDGRAPSIWDTFCAQPGRIADKSSGKEACDEYHRYPEDIELMKKLGVRAYRFSVAWPRIVPSADGKINQRGIDHYLRLLDALREADIKPVLTMYHWDLPQYLQDQGGWPSRETALRFADYAQALARAFGDRVDTWTTLNEPWCTAYLGYGNGSHAPGIQDYEQALKAVHHLNLAHGLAAQAVHHELGDDAKVSVTLNLAANIAVSDSADDIAAKRRADLFANEVFLGPMLEGRYDPEIAEATSDIIDWDFVRDGDMETIRQPLAALGVNYYSSNHVRRAASVPEADEDDRHFGAMPAQQMVETLPPEGQLTAMGWNQEPAALTQLLVELSKRFPDTPLMITENGSAWDDTVEADASMPNGAIVHDPDRVAYLNAHIRAMADAMEAGANVIGYFAWSLLDNFEWALGYTKRFGIVRVDYSNQQRIWKDSGLRYAQIVKANAI
ncbi:GH1 family beta-glucosidase [Bifidobacterium sp. ESL0690]|uniref:GH1 family beta-glucosidase n=1 Tax=Bifidobacterium sp. ESL0690 TaxID=2983214 RepID=UPI0023F68340|nr:GH1 family beta-glucosidase [Bifidobacterium sp. ESL0690]WEV46762.1 GH1 family beta-glucosidase [Bifidobacterium sp. ESL0690]